jgi:putative protease
VYAGLPKFNAREMAHNFSYEDMSRLSAFCKKKNKRFYLTFNTLIKEGELMEAAESLESAASLDPDGIIIQDLGVVSMVRDFFPHVELHASTQMGIHNSEGVKAAAELGIRRVILERQVTLDELRRIAGESPIEIEVFIHGALCASLSGRCLFSSWIGGWSGNRGKCKQPCRRRYHPTERSGGSSGFFFSTQDLYSLDLLEEYSRMGIASLKIEGRLKKGSYIAPVVRAYRMGLDAVAEGRGSDISRAKQELSHALGRKWTRGFATEEDMEEVIQPANPGVSGLLIGEVSEGDGGRRRGFDVRLSRPLHVGDRIRVQTKSGDESPSITVTKMKQGGATVKRARDGVVHILADAEIPRDGRVYKVSAGTKTPGPSAEKLPLYTPRIRVDVKIRISEGEIRGQFRPVGIHRDTQDYSSWWVRPLLTEPAQNRAVTQEEVEEQFSVTRVDHVQAGKVEAKCEGGLFVPAGELKRARREFWEWLVPRLPESLGEAKSAVYEHVKERMEELEGRAARRKAEVRPGKVTCMTGVAVSDLDRRCTRAALPLDAAKQLSAPAEYEVELPHFVQEGSFDRLRTDVEELYRNGVRRFRLTDLSHLLLFTRLAYSDVELTAGYPFPVTNSFAAAEVAEWGVETIQAWIELEKTAIEELIGRNPVTTEIYEYGRPFLLAGRAHLGAEGLINDPRGRKFFILARNERGISYILPYETLSIPVEELEGKDMACYRDVRDIHPGEETETSSFNFFTELV